MFAWLHYHPFVREPFPSEEDDCESEEKLRCSLLRPRDPKREAIEQNERLYQLHREQGERFNSQLALEELLDSDWVVQVEKEHLVSFWQLSGITPRLGAHDAPSRAMPVLSLWLKTKVSRSYGFPNPLVMIPLCQEVGVTREPSRVVFQLLNGKGQLCFWDLSMSESAEHRSSTSRWCSRMIGHRTPVTSLAQHTSGPLIASIAETGGEGIIWSVSDTSLIECSQVIQPQMFLESAKGVVWLSEGIYLTYDDAGFCKVSTIPPERKQGLETQLIASFACKEDFGGNVVMEKIYLLPATEKSNSVFQLLSLSKGGSAIHFWSLDITGATVLKPKTAKALKCLQKVSLSSSEAILCVSFPPESSNSKLYRISNDSPHSFTFASGSMDGSVRLWRFNDETKEWSSAAQFTAHSGEILELFCSDSFEVTTLGARGEADSNGEPSTGKKGLPYDIRSWERISQFPRFAMKQVVTLPDAALQKGAQGSGGALAAVSMTRNRGRRAGDFRTGSIVQEEQREKEEVISPHFALQRLSNGLSMMAVSVSCTIYIYLMKIPDETHSFELQWTRTPIEYSTAHPCGAITWDLKGNLIVSGGSQLIIFSPWLDVAPQMKMQEKMGLISQQATLFGLPPPPFHPKVLFQYLLAGKFERADKILRVLLACLRLWSETNPDKNRVAADQLAQPLLSELIELTDYEATAACSFNSSSTGSGDTSTSFGQDTAASLFGAPSQASSLFAPSAASSLFGGSSSSSFFSPTTSFVMAEEEETPEEDKQEEQPASSPEELPKEKEPSMTTAEAEELCELLSRIQIVGFLRSDQMYLIAVIGTFMQMESLKSGLDECGVRFLLSVKLAEILRKTTDRSAALSSRDYCWALHCEASEALTQQTLPPDATWSVAQALGIGYWMTNVNALRETVKRIAQVEFSLKKSAEDCAIFYVALGQKSSLMALFKAVGNKKVADFLMNDFKEPRWASAASKNAYALLGRQQYRYAAAFFLLAGQTKSAVGLC